MHQNQEITIAPSEKTLQLKEGIIELINQVNKKHIALFEMYKTFANRHMPILEGPLFYIDKINKEEINLFVDFVDSFLIAYVNLKNLEEYLDDKIISNADDLYKMVKTVIKQNNHIFEILED